MPLFGPKKRPVPTSEPVDASKAHAVITHLPLSDDEYGTHAERDAIHALEHRIDDAVSGFGGDHDGDEFGGGEVVLWTYGPDADRLFEAIERCLADAGGPDFQVREGAYAIKRHGEVGDPNAREERVRLR